MPPTRKWRNDRARSWWWAPDRLGWRRRKRPPSEGRRSRFWTSVPKREARVQATRPEPPFCGGARKDRQFARGQALLDRVRNLGVAILNEATVWDAYAAVTEDGRTNWRSPWSRAAEPPFTRRSAYRRRQAYGGRFPFPGGRCPALMTTGSRPGELACGVARLSRPSSGERTP